jgi:hypothetical protein
MQPQDPGSHTEPGAPSVSLYFRGNCRSDILSLCPMSTDSTPSNPGLPPQEEVSDKLNESAAKKHQYNAKNGKEKKLWIMRFFSETKATDWAITFLTAGLLVVGYWQWQVIKGRLGEMQASGKQTDQLIGLYREQVNTLGQQTEKLGEQATKLGQQVAQTRVLAEQAKISNAQTLDALHKSQRPWIGPYKQVPIVTGPIIVDSMGIRVDYRMSAVNFGSFGANNVGFLAQLYIAQDITTIQKRAKYACDNSTSNPDLGRVLFPGENTAMLNVWPAFAMDIIPNKNANPPQKVYQAYLLVCIGYRDQFGIPHHTGTIYRSVHPESGETILFELTPTQSIPVEWRDWHSFLD